MRNMQDIFAADVMESDVVTFRPSTPITEALQTFEELRISGAPVVDEYGRIVGMLTTADVARSSHSSEGRIDAEGGNAAMTEPFDAESEDGMDTEDVVLSMEDYGAQVSERPTVGDWMSTPVRSAAPEWTLVQVCRLMKQEHIHRVPVVKDRRLVGIISSFDVVCCVADGVVKRVKKSPAR
jgi:CBS domain-containing protein